MDDFRTRVEGERPYLLRYARLQLRDRQAAEDAVQDALVAAIAGEKGFAGRASLRTWLTGILKHKIVDRIRQSQREATLFAGETDTADFDALFDETGHWSQPPADWGSPDAALGQKQFFAALEACLGQLPQKTSQAFLMREHLGSDTTEICKELGVTSTHCWVLLYRARMALRECLEKSWFRK